MRLQTRTFDIDGKPVRLRLEMVFWDMLDDVIQREQVSIEDAIRRVQVRKGQQTLAGAVRMFVARYMRTMAATARRAEGLAEADNASSRIQEVLAHLFGVDSQD